MINSIAYDVDGTMVISLSGDLDVYFAPEMMEAVEKAFLERPARIRLECGGLEYVDSMGLGVLVKINALSKEHGPLQLRQVNQRVLRLLKITHLDTLFDIEEQA